MQPRQTRLPGDKTSPRFGTRLNFAHPLAKGLVGAWLFNEGAGNVAYDSSRNDNNGAFSGNKPLWGNSGVNFKSSGTGYVDVGAGGLGNSSFSVVIQCLNLTDNAVHYLIDNGTGTNGGFQCFLQSDNTIRTRIDDSGANGGVFDGDDTSIVEDKEHHFVMTADKSGNALMYIDNTLQASSLNISGYGDISGTDDLHIGSGVGGVSGWYGWFRYCYVYDRALTAREVAQLYRDPYQMYRVNPIWWLGADAGGATAITPTDIAATTQVVDAALTATREIVESDVASATEVADAVLTATREIASADVQSATQVADVVLTVARELSITAVSSLTSVASVVLTALRELSVSDVSSATSVGSPTVATSVTEVTLEDIASSTSVGDVLLLLNREIELGNVSSATSIASPSAEATASLTKHNKIVYGRQIYCDETDINCDSLKYNCDGTLVMDDIVYQALTNNNIVYGRQIYCDNTEIYCDSTKYNSDGTQVMNDIVY